MNPDKKYSLKNLPVLNDEQKKFILDNYDKLDLGSLTRHISKDPMADGRSFWGISIREFLASYDIKAKTSAEYVSQAKPDFELNEYQRQFIETNAKEMKPLEMLKLLFPEEKITLLHKQGKAVYKYYKDVIGENEIDMWEEPAEGKEYKPPVNFQAMIGKANAYVPNPIDPTKSTYDYNNLKKMDEKNLRITLGYMKTPRFRFQASMYDKKIDRILFESTFIRFVTDKASELTPEEVDQYIAAASETINISQLERMILSMEKMVNDILNGDSDSEEKKKLSLNHVELINGLRTKLTDSKKHRETLITNLAGSRNERIDKKMQNNSSILNLLEAWMEEEPRLQLIALGELEKKEDMEETNALSDMDAVKCLIAGMNKKEGGYG